ncbi:hypothetical protein MMC10_007783 [Thelotrema lepadinum]|nr:hypothetical protein [Thelotrema lepadinum]
MSAPSSSTRDDHVFTIFWLPFQDNPCGWNNVWKPVKDLLRTLLRQEFEGKSNGPREEPRVYVENEQYGRYYAITSFKEERLARRIFERLAGNSWHESTLSVVWVKPLSSRSVRLIDVSNKSSHPVRLDKVSPIRDNQLLWQQPLPGPHPFGRRDHMQAQISIPDHPFRAPTQFKIDPQELLQIECALSHRCSLNEAQQWMANRTSIPVAPNPNFAWPTSQFAPQPTSAFGSNNSSRPPNPQPRARPPPRTQRGGRPSGPTPGSARSTPQSQRKKANKELKKQETQQSAEKKMDSGPVIADGSGEGVA